MAAQVETKQSDTIYVRITHTYKGCFFYNVNMADMCGDLSCDTNVAEGI